MGRKKTLKMYKDKDVYFENDSDDDDDDEYKYNQKLEKEYINNMIDDDIIFDIYRNIKNYTKKYGINLCEKLTPNDLNHFISNLKYR